MASANTIEATDEIIMWIDLYENLEPTPYIINVSEEFYSRIQRERRVPMTIKENKPVVPLFYPGDQDSMTITVKQEYYEPVYKNGAAGHPYFIGMQKIKE